MVKLCWEQSVAVFRHSQWSWRGDDGMMDPGKLAHRGKTWWSLQVINNHTTHTYYTTLTLTIHLQHTLTTLVCNTEIYRSSPCFEMLAYQTTNFRRHSTSPVMKMTSSTKSFWMFHKHGNLKWIEMWIEKFMLHYHCQSLIDTHIGDRGALKLLNVGISDWQTLGRFLLCKVPFPNWNSE